MKIRHLGLLAIGSAVGLMACNSNSNGSASTDSTTSTTSTATTTQTSSRNYAAMADSFRTNSAAGNYLDPRSGKPFRLSIDTATGAVTDETTHQPIRRYVDKRTWWVYDTHTGDTIGTARMEKGTLRYRGENEQWMSYEERWHDTDTMGTTGNGTNNDSSMSSAAGNNNKMSGAGSSGSTGKMKIKTDDHKIKVNEKGEV